MRSFDIGTARVAGARLLVVAGPCVVESAELCLTVATRLKELCAARDLPFIFKSSYRKANRSSVKAFSGLAPEEALGVLARVRREVGVPVITDVHETGEVASAAEIPDTPSDAETEPSRVHRSA